MKKAMKDLFSQLIEDFLDGMNTLKDETLRQHSKTRNALARVEKKIESLNSKSKSLPSSTVTSSASSRMASPPSSSSTTPPKPSEGGGIPRKATPNKPKQTAKKANRPKTEYQHKPRALLVGDSIVHNANFRIIEEVTHSSIKTSKAYSSVWDKDARFKHLNVTDVVKNELGKAPFEHLILASPTVDISNIDTSKVKPEDSTETFKHKVQISCQNILRVAESSLDNHTGLKKVTIMNNAPRFDAHKVDPVGIKPKLLLT